eukprot:GHVU01061638.1.p3 GENE.GHVU01061638.1~~GHVU01061638.1.p3  ORF type:complete len:114 (+),score=1.97 GHVU01061638.1:1153-1494(+)
MHRVRSQQLGCVGGVLGDVRARNDGAHADYSEWAVCRGRVSHSRRVGDLHGQHNILPSSSLLLPSFVPAMFRPLHSPTGSRIPLPVGTPMMAQETTLALHHERCSGRRQLPLP